MISVGCVAIPYQRSGQCFRSDAARSKAAEPRCHDLCGARQNRRHGRGERLHLETAVLDLRRCCRRISSCRLAGSGIDCLRHVGLVLEGVLFPHYRVRVAVEVGYQLSRPETSEMTRRFHRHCPHHCDFDARRKMAARRRIQETIKAVTAVCMMPYLRCAASAFRVQPMAPVSHSVSALRTTRNEGQQDRYRSAYCFYGVIQCGKCCVGDCLRRLVRSTALVRISGVETQGWGFVFPTQFFRFRGHSN